MTKDDLRESLRDAGADTAKAMMDALEDGAVLAQLQPAGMSEADFQLVVEALHAELRAEQAPPKPILMITCGDGKIIRCSSRAEAVATLRDRQAAGDRTCSVILMPDFGSKLTRDEHLAYAAGLEAEAGYKGASEAECEASLDAATRQYLSSIGRRGRAVNSHAQQEAARENGKRGGRPVIDFPAAERAEIEACLRMHDISMRQAVTAAETFLNAEDLAAAEKWGQLTEGGRVRNALGVQTPSAIFCTIIERNNRDTWHDIERSERDEGIPADPLFHRPFLPWERYGVMRPTIARRLVKRIAREIGLE